MRYLLPMIIYIALTAFVIADISQHRDEEPYRLPKVLWLLIVLFAPFVGAAAWLVVRWWNKPARPSDGYDLGASPDDDPAFKVWAVEQERRRRQEGRG